VVGEEVMRELYNLDHIAYVRFASVYRSFKDINQFMDELKDLLDRQKQEKVKGGKAKE
jgi:transcriptional repressor NrdR